MANIMYRIKCDIIMRLLRAIVKIMYTSDLKININLNKQNINKKKYNKQNA